MRLHYQPKSLFSPRLAEILGYYFHALCLLILRLKGNEIHHAVESSISKISGYVTLGHKYLELHDSILKRRKDELILHGVRSLLYGIF